jgi:hypothetical protein
MKNIEIKTEQHKGKESLTINKGSETIPQKDVEFGRNIK